VPTGIETFSLNDSAPLLDHDAWPFAAPPV